MRTYPLILLGFVKDQVRLEKVGGGGEWYPWKNKLFFFCDGKSSAISAPNDTRYGVTHIQYRSRFGFFVAWPFCLHFWIQKEFQKSGQPGTEKCFYVRSPGWRWLPTVPGFERTWGYCGLRWD